MSTERVRTTYTHLLSWPDDGRRYELYDGEVSVVPAPLPRHQLAMLNLARALVLTAPRTKALGHDPNLRWHDLLACLR